MCPQALNLISHVGYIDSMSTSREFYCGLVEAMSDDGLGNTLGVNEEQLNDLFCRYEIRCQGIYI